MDVETIEVGNAIREIKRLRRAYGLGRWDKGKGIATVRLSNGMIASLKSAVTKHTVAADRSSRSKTISTRTPRGRRRPRGFVLCVKNDGYGVSLERRKLYPAIPDAAAAAHGQVRVIDESGEDYVFPRRLFVALDLPATVRRALA